MGPLLTEWSAGHGASDVCGAGARLEEASHAARGVSREDGRSGSLRSSGGAGRGVLSEGRARSASLSAGGDAARALRAVVLQPERPRDGGPALRGGVGAPLRGAAPVGCVARRDDDSALPPPAGEARSGGEAVRGEQRASGLARAPLEHGDDRGREPHRRAVVDEEPHRGAGPADAPDEEGQSVVLRDEGAPRCGCAVGLDAQSGDDAGERLGRGGDARAGARGRGAGVGRRPAIKGWASARRAGTRTWTGGWR